MRNKIKWCRTILFCTFCVPSVWAQSGGNFSVTQSVTAGGGQSSAGGNFTAVGSIGQAAAGMNLTGGNFTVRGGFWTFSRLSPTAAQVSLGGRVLTAEGTGIRNVRVTLTASNGATRTALTASFGYYRFEDVPVGETYVVSVAAKRFTFSQPVVVCTIFEEIGDLNFIADFN